MEIIVKPVREEDRKDCIRVEAATMEFNRYIDDVWGLFKETKGELLGAFVDGKLQGMGKITKLYNGFGWLETLRVHPDFQGKGLGKAIYKEYFNEAKRIETDKLGMYTEGHNVVSKGLAERNGLVEKGFYTEWVKDIDKEANTYNYDFSFVLEEEAEDLLKPHLKEMGDFIVINRTFYPVRKELASHLAKNKWLYKDEEGNILIAGNRFHKEKLLHVPFFLGDNKKLQAFSEYLAYKQKAKQVSRLQSDMEDTRVLEDLGYKKLNSYYTMWTD